MTRGEGNIERLFKILATPLRTDRDCLSVISFFMRIYLAMHELDTISIPYQFTFRNEQT